MTRSAAAVFLPEKSLGSDSLDFPSKSSWLNIARSLSLQEEPLKGRVVVLAIWNLGCPTSLEMLKIISELLKDFKRSDIYCIGVHSPKFPYEEKIDNVRDAVLQHSVDMPVVMDNNKKITNDLGVKSVPSVAVIGPSGTLLSLHDGTKDLFMLKISLTSALSAVQSERLGGPPLPLAPEKPVERVPRKAKRGRPKKNGVTSGLGSGDQKEQVTAHPKTPLSYPVKIATGDGHIFVADTGNHRVLILEEDGTLIDCIGGVVDLHPGFKDGDYTETRFNSPTGLTYDDEEDVLFVCDSGNHSIRKVDLLRRTVTTVAGTGKEGSQADQAGGRIGTEQPLSSPADVLIYRGYLSGPVLFIALSGWNQVWQLDLRSNVCGPIPCAESTSKPWQRPLSMTTDPGGSLLYVANAYTSSVRVLDLKRSKVSSVIGGSADDPSDSDLHGDSDGWGHHARLQHPSAVLWLGVTWKLAEATRVRRRLDGGDVTGGDDGGDVEEDMASERLQAARLEAQRRAVIRASEKRRGKVEQEGTEMSMNGSPGGEREAKLQLDEDIGRLYELGQLVIADSYNHRIKLCNIRSRKVEAWAGSGKEGFQDGSLSASCFSSPSGLALSTNQEKVFVCDTNNHAIRVIDTKSNSVSTLALRANTESDMCLLYGGASATPVALLEEVRSVPVPWQARRLDVDQSECKVGCLAPASSDLTVQVKVREELGVPLHEARFGEKFGCDSSFIKISCGVRDGHDYVSSRPGRFFVTGAVPVRDKVPVRLEVSLLQEEDMLKDKVGTLLQTDWSEALIGQFGPEGEVLVEVRAVGEPEFVGMQCSVIVEVEMPTRPEGPVEDSGERSGEGLGEVVMDRFLWTIPARVCSYDVVTDTALEFEVPQPKPNG